MMTKYAEEREMCLKVFPGRDEVIENIRRSVKRGQLNAKVETGDPVLPCAERKRLLYQYVNKNPGTLDKLAEMVAEGFTLVLNRDTLFDGMDKLKEIKGGAIITANHFNPAENTIYRKISWKCGRKLCPVTQDTNLKMTGLFGFLIKHTDVIPVSCDMEYMNKYFGDLLRKALEDNKFVLIYPEEEMWFNYRKPRKLKRGAYFYAAQNNVPVISCFTEIRALPEFDCKQFHKVTYVVHILDTIYPDSQKSVRQNSIEMMERDYLQKLQAYEKAYGKKLCYDFEVWDIAGWEP